MRIVFFGTPDFAVASLKSLVESGKNIVGVVTAPDKPAGRGQQVQISAVKAYAQEKNLNILQPINLKSEEFIMDLKELNPDLQIIVAFRMLPEAVWSLPPKGTFNLHGSLLPQYRGAAPIHWAVINGEKETGVTTFFLKHEIDTGNIIYQDKEAISPDDTTGTLYNRLMERGANLVLKTVDDIETNSIKTYPQKESIELKKAPKLTKELGNIDFNQDGQSIINLIRGLNPFPSAYTEIQEKQFKIFKAKFIEDFQTKLQPGEYQTDQKSYLNFGCKNGYISILDAQLQGKKRMEIKEFLMGYRF
jgi:methionyl-tRNA formyltransferase